MNYFRASTLCALLAAATFTPVPAFAATGTAAPANPVHRGRADAAKPPAADDNWREAAEKRIEQHRKAALEVAVLDEQGRAIPNASVAVKMTRHHFGFGALIGTSRWDNRPNAEDARRHLRLVAERFNKVVTIPNPEERSSNDALDWLAERGIRVRGHYLMWAPVQPERGRLGQPASVLGKSLPKIAELDEARRAAIRAAAFAHVERMLKFAGPRVAEWDAINHIANDAHVRFSDIFGVQIYADIIKRGRELAPHAQMWVNEGNVLTAGNREQKYHAVISELIALGTKPDGIGFMAHFREGELTPPAEIYRRLDRFAALVPNLQLTELDIDTSNEQLQADTMRDVLTIAFSHPAVSGIVMWQIWGQGAGNKTLWRADWSIKPAGQVWLDLVGKAWWTEATGVTDASGRFTTRGFLGEYEISAETGGRTKTVLAKISPGGGAVAVQF